MRPFTISLQVHHLSQDLTYLTEALATQPAVCMTAGVQLDGTLRKTSVWHALLFQGITKPDFDRSVEHLLAFLKERESVLAPFAGDEGMMELIFTFRLDVAQARAGEIAHSVNLHPFLLYELASRQIGVKVQTAYSA